jgi:tRNA nucleotidyltransferase/poly(A) polymerase
MKHSKYRNTGLLFELLTRQITADILNNTKSSTASEILRKNFHKKSQLFKENQLFNVVIESKFKSKDRAVHLVETTVKAYNKIINTSALKREKYELIKQIKENFTLTDFFQSRVSNYRLLAAIHNVITENYSKSHHTLIEHMTRVVRTKESSTLSRLREENKDLRALAYKILIERFNKKYSALNSNQKELLREYINNISNTNGLNEFMESKFKSIVHELKKTFSKISDKVIKIKIKECIHLIESTNIQGKHTSNVLKLMRFYQLLEDVKHATKS